MRRSAVFIGAAMLMLAACDTKLQQQTTAKSQRTGNVAHDRLLELDLDSRAVALGAVVNSSGYRCKAKDSFFMGVYAKDNSAFWSVHCSNGNAYQVSIMPDSGGSTKVMDCAILKAVTDVDCFLRFDAQPHRTRTKKQIQADLKRLTPAQQRDAIERLKENLGR